MDDGDGADEKQMHLDVGQSDGDADAAVADVHSRQQAQAGRGVGAELPERPEHSGGLGNVRVRWSLTEFA